MLVAFGGGLTINPVWLNKTMMDAPLAGGDDSFMCILRAVSASNLEEHGIHFGFVGNESYPATQPKK
jgi:hypothetical protein